MGVIEHSHVIENAVTLGGGGNLTPATVAMGTETGTPGQYLTIVADPMDAAAAVVIGSADPDYSNDALQATSGQGAALAGTASNGGIGVYGSGQGAGAFGGEFSADAGTGVSGATATGTGGGFSASDPAGQALVVSGQSYFAGGPLVLAGQTAPATPPSGAVALYVDSADGKAKIKDAAGTVHALW